MNLLIHKNYIEIFGEIDSEGFEVGGVYQKSKKQKVVNLKIEMIVYFYLMPKCFEKERKMQKLEKFKIPKNLGRNQKNKKKTTKQKIKDDRETTSYLRAQKIGSCLYSIFEMLKVPLLKDTSFGHCKNLKVVDENEPRPTTQYSIMDRQLNQAYNQQQPSQQESIFPNLGTQEQCLIQVSPDFKGKLHPYQQEALNWMSNREKNGIVSYKSHIRGERSLDPLWCKFKFSIDNSKNDAFLKEYQEGRLSLELSSNPNFLGAYIYFCPYTGDMSLVDPSENKRLFGGIIGDEMGLGKTVQMISLMLTRKLEDRILRPISDLIVNQEEVFLEIQDLQTPLPDPSIISQNPTLDNIDLDSNKISENKKIVLKKFKDVNQEDLHKYQLSIRHTLAKLESTSKKERNFEKIGHNLIIVPTSLIDQWCTEIQKFSKNNNFTCIDLYNLTSQKRRDLDKIMENTNVIISSYGKVKNDILKPDSKYLKYYWHRIVLDEAHEIRNPKSLAFKAISRLRGEYKWCLTGTPIQNNITDIQSLFKFLRYEPFCDQYVWNKEFKKMAENTGGDLGNKNFEGMSAILKPVFIRRTKVQQFKCLKLPPKIEIYEKIELGKEDLRLYKKIFTKARDEISCLENEGGLKKGFLSAFSIIMNLRRICDHRFMHSQFKASIAPSPDLADKIKVMILKRQNINQARNHQRSASTSRNLDGGYSNGSRYSSFYTGPLHRNPSLQVNQQYQASSGRRRASHGQSSIMPVVSTGIEDDSRFNVDMHKKIVEKLIQGQPPEDQIFCPICLEDSSIEAPAITACQHLFCSECIIDWLKKGSTCPSCRAPLDSKLDVILLPVPKCAENQGSYKSPKIEKMIEILKSKIEKNEKIVIFSHFLKMIEYMTARIQEENIKYAVITGAIPQKRRASIVKEFQSDPSLKVVIISIKAGGQGLNLVAANNIFIMEPWWNIAVEDQAVDRVHRIGQQNQVTVTKFIMSNTIEERIVKIQKSKIDIVRNIIKTSENDENIGNIRQLFNLDGGNEQFKNLMMIDNNNNLQQQQ